MLTKINTLTSGGASKGFPSVPRHRTLARSKRKPSTWYSRTLIRDKKEKNQYTQVCSMYTKVERNIIYLYNKNVHIKI